MHADTNAMGWLASTYAKLEDLLHRYNELTNRQLQAMVDEDLKSASRLAKQAEGIIHECWKTGRQIASAQAVSADRATDYTGRKRRLRQLGGTAEWNTKNLETLLLAQRKQLLKTIGQLESASPEPIAAGARAGHANLINIKT